MLLATLIIMLLPLVGAGAVQQDKTDKSIPKNPFAGDAKAIEVGRVRFRMSCAGCHGLHATGGRSGPDLTRGTFASGDTDADLYSVIAKGIPGSEMDGFGDSLESDELWQVVSYVRTLAAHEAVPAAGDKAAGEQLFWAKGGCGRCHRVGARGSSVGPDLTRTGAQRSLAYLKESIVDPDADVTSGYATITVVTRDKGTITGVEKGFDNFSVRLMDLSGRYYSFLNDEVTSVKREIRSLMPQTYRRLFSDAELHDLLAYLTALRGGDR